VDRVGDAGCQRACRRDRQQWGPLSQRHAPSKKIELGERALALEPAVPTWSLEIPRQRFKAELSAGLGCQSHAWYVRRQYVEDAIAHFEAALTVLTQEKDPDRWAAAQNNLANAFSKRLRGQQADNREMAIAHLEAALSVCTEQRSTDRHRQADCDGLAPARCAFQQAEARQSGKGRILALLRRVVLPCRPDPQYDLRVTERGLVYRLPARL